MLQTIKDWWHDREAQPTEVDEVAQELAAKGVFSTDLSLNANGIDRRKLLMELTERAFPVNPYTNYIETTPNGSAMDSDGGGVLSSSLAGDLKSAFALGFQRVPDSLLSWYITQSFIGYQSCSLIAQHWLVDKACTMPAEDATRNGYEITVGDGDEVDTKVFDALKQADIEMEILSELSRAAKWNNVYGIRHILFNVEGVNTELPLNMDRIRPGSYKGITQIDPYWITPVLDQEGIADPASKYFYEPKYWIIAGKRYHRSHFAIMRGPEVSDILKPSYLYGGLPLTQRIYERVYAAERMANEIPQLAMTKRLTTLKVDLSKAVANQRTFEERVAEWTALRDNHGIKVVGLEEDVGQRDTSLTDLDDSTLVEYQIVAAISGIPMTKLMGSSPSSGFMSNGDHETDSYEERLESIQRNDLNPVLRKHVHLCLKSKILPDMGIDEFSYDIKWNPTHIPSAKEVAETNFIKSQTDLNLRNSGALGPKDVRKRVVRDIYSGHDGLDEDDIPEEGYDPPDKVGEQESDEAGSEKSKPLASKQNGTSGKR